MMQEQLEEAALIEEYSDQENYDLDGAEQGFLAAEDGSIVVEGEEYSLGEGEVYFGTASEVSADHFRFDQELYGQLEQANSLGNQKHEKFEDVDEYNFFFGHSEDYPWELKLAEERLDDEMRHSHDGYETYMVLDGEIVLENGTREEEVDTENPIYTVAPRQEHMVTETYNDPLFAVARYKEELSDQPIKKVVDGEVKENPHIDERLEFSAPETAV